MESAAFATTLLWQICLGLSLSACTGLRAFLPLFATGIIARTGFAGLHFNDSFVWIGSDAALIIFGSATLIEILGDKFPAIDHFLDTVGVVIKPVAATLLFFSVTSKIDPILAVVLGLIAGGGVSEAIHLKKAGLRIASSGISLGFLNPLISFIEDLIAAAGIIISIIAPILAFSIVILCSIIAFRIYGSCISKIRKKQLENAPQNEAQPA